MGQIRIITDTASDITRQRAEELDVIVVPISIKFGETEMPMESEEDFHRFFRRLAEEKELPTTSQPSPELYLKEYNEAKEKGEDVLVLTLSSGLSGTINAARLAKDMCGYDRIFIVDTRQAIIPQQMLVEYAVRQRAQGVGAEEIAEKIEDVRDRMVVCGVLDTLTYLRKGGRIPPGFDVLGNVLKIKPVIELKDGILVKLGVARGMRKGKDFLFREYEACEIDEEWPVVTGYTYDRESGEKFRQEVQERYHLAECPLWPVGGVIGTHVGENCLALAFVKKVQG
ncbi:MAG: DegV family protein [Massilistercora timonensis]|uniref:DegV family protein n=1 Tax=Massilistercora timonensis TaxID=2086584 RepID=UPI002FAC05E9